MKNNNRNKWLSMFFYALTLICLPIWLGNQAYAAIIIDHTCTDLSKVPQAWIEQAQNDLRLSYGHTSHGSQLITGIGAIRDFNSLYRFNTNGAITAGVLSIADYTPAGDLGNPDYTTWASLTCTYLNGAGSNRNVVMWSWCGEADTSEANITLYLSQMNQLEHDFSGVTFIYMTGHLNGGGQSGNLHQRNEQIRTYCRANNKILYDFADIESYDPSGVTNYLLLGGGLDGMDGCQYNGGNWANEWLAANPGSELAQIAGLCGGCAHSETLNCVLKGRAFWWLMARIAGWNGTFGPTYTISGVVTLSGTVTPLQGVTLSGLPGNPMSSTTGYYSAAVPEGWSGTVTPTLTGYTFDPTHIDYSNVTSNQNQDYTATPVPTYTISGTILHDGAGLEGVAMNGLPGTPLSSTTGYYSAAINQGWSGTVTPALAGYSFDPTHIEYSNVASNQENQDYTAERQTSIEINGGGGGGGGCFIASAAQTFNRAILALFSLLILFTLAGIYHRKTG